MSITAFTTGIKRACAVLGVAMGLLDCKGDIENFPESTGNYYYVNTLDDTIVLRVFSKSSLSFSSVIPPDDSIHLISKVSGDVVGAMQHIPFGISDSASIQFDKRLCLGYSKFDSTVALGLWNLANYRNYAPDVTQRPEYTLSYDIGARDTLLAVPCP